jgi:hypothetical protein
MFPALNVGQLADICGVSNRLAGVEGTRFVNGSAPESSRGNSAKVEEGDRSKPLERNGAVGEADRNLSGMTE